MVKQEEIDQLNKTNIKSTIKEVELTSIITQTGEAFKLPNGEIVSMNEYLVWMGNCLYKTMKGVTGSYD